MHKKSVVSFIIVIVFLSLIVALVFFIPKQKTITRVLLGGVDVHVTLADTPVLQERGLSGVSSLIDTEGMLFVFQKVGKYPFWMKEMKFPLDIIWIGEDLKVVTIEKNAKPESYPNVLGGGVDAKYVLEVNAGFADKNKVKVGDTVELLP